MKGYIGYIRVSTVRQGEHGSSLQEQRSAIEAYAVRHSLPIADWVEERETAAKEGRRRFNVMITMLMKRQATGVIIHKIDRSARNLRDWARLGELIDRGIDVRFVHESLDLASRGGRLAADIQAVVAADYVRNLRDEVRKGIRGRLNQGIWPFPAPLGYNNEGGGKPKSIDPVKGQLVRTAFELYATGAYPLEKLREEMERRGLRNRAGSSVSRTGIWMMLRESFYVGLMKVKRTGQVYQGVHEPLVRKPLFDRCQAILTGRTYVFSGKHDFSYSRFIVCQDCNRALVGELQKGHIYYRCHTRTCRGVSFNERVVGAELARFLSFVAFEGNDLRELGEMRDEAEQSDATRRVDAKTAAKREVGRCNDLLNRLTDAYLTAAIDNELFQSRKAALLHERQGYQQQLDLPSEISEDLDRIQKLELGNTAILQAKAAKWTELRDAVSRTVSNLTADGKCLGIRPCFPFDEIAKTRSVMDGGPYRYDPRTKSFVVATPETSGF